MRKFATFVLFCVLALAANAIPAKRGWQTRTQADGSTIEVQLVGDEYYHYTINRDGQRVRENENGMFEVVGEAPSASEFNVRRAKAKERRAPKAIGTQPNLAPKGVVILVNFADVQMNSKHTQAVFDELCNSENCTVNNGYPSAAQYFADQSDGKYHPVFDVFGPVTLGSNMKYYGEDNAGEEEGDDKHATDAVVEGCKKADMQFDINWADYDSDNDGEIDFVYVIYAGKGQADGGSTNTIWPHNWEVSSAISYGYCTYKSSECVVGGKRIENYAMSSELSGNKLGGIGTLCHEFGHVMGLPDFYDTSYGTNYRDMLTPNDWDVMDGGAYNGDGHCPPNYSPWEKDFFGWHKPLNLGTEGQKLTLYANGTENYQAYQVNASGEYVSPTTAGQRFYFENRQQQGWDQGLPAEGLLIWKVNFNASKWTNNEPNKTANNPYYTIVCSEGSEIGTDSYNDLNFGEQNVFPYNQVNSWSGVSGKPLKEITRVGETIELVYIEEPEIPIEPFELVWYSNGKEFAKTNSTGKVVMPDKEPSSGKDGVDFVGWCRNADYQSETTAPTFVKEGDKAEEGDKFYAVFAKKSEGTAEETKSYTFESKSWEDAANIWSSIQDGFQYNKTNEGVQITASFSGAGAETTIPYDNVTKVVVTYCTNANNGEGEITVTVGDEEEITLEITKTGGTTMRDLEFIFDSESGVVSFEVTCTTNSIYIQSVTITTGGGDSYSEYTTSTDSETALENTTADQTVTKTVRNGQMVIIRGDAVYTLTGARVQ